MENIEMHQREHESLVVELTSPATIYYMVQMVQGYGKKLNNVKEI